MKRIIFTVTNDLTYDQRMHKICGSLAANGYSVLLVGRNLKTSVPLDGKSFEQRRLTCFLSKGKLFYIEYNFRLFLFLLFQKYDGACSIDLDTIVAVYFASVFKTEKPKLVYDAHEYFTEVPEVINRPVVKKIWQWIEQIFLPKYDLVYTVSPAIAELFSKKYDKPVKVIMNVPWLEQNPVETFSAHQILYQGALNEGRGLEVLIEASKEVGAELLLAGEGDLSMQLREQVNLLNLESKVKFLGRIKPKELKRITASAYIGINLLENKGLSYYYSLSNKFFDYIHAGVPQLCIGFPEYEKLNAEFEVALLVNNCDVREIKIALQRLLTDKEMYQRLKNNCAACKLYFNWQNEEQKLIKLYGQLF